MTNLLQNAMALHQAGMLADAENAYRLVLNAEPHQADALALLGTVLSEKKEHDAAIALIERALVMDPQAALFYFHLGNVCEKAARLLQSEAAFVHAIALAPNWAEAYYNLGNVQRRLKKIAEAKETYLKALGLNRAHILSHNNLAHVFSELLDYASARKQLETAMAIAPHDVQLLFSLHDIAHEHNDFSTVFSTAQRLAEIKLGLNEGHTIFDYLSDNSTIDSNDEQVRNCIFALGTSFFLKGDLKKASYVLRSLFALEPDIAEVPLMLGSVALAQNKLDHADHYYAQAFMLNPAESGAPWNRAMNLLVSGDLREGFRRYRWRWSAMDKFKAMRMNAELWDGSNPSGKTILVQEEQGFGDTLQMLRYLPQLMAQGATVYAYVRPVLFPLIEHWDGAHKIVAWNVEDKTVPAEVDAVCGMMDLPGLMETGIQNIPNSVPYLPNPKKGMPQFKLTGNGIKVGLVWAGNPLHKRDHERSIPFEMWDDVLTTKGVTFYSLQYKPKADDINRMGTFGVIDLAPHIKNLADTAATLAELDLLITIDSAPAHLAGALGIPVWNLITINPDWRWLLGRDDSPWYPSMRLFRQSNHGDWAGVMINVKNALEKYRDEGT